MTFHDVRRIASALPETVETTSYPTPSFKAGRKMICRLREEGDVLVVVTDAGTKQALLLADPGVYFETPHYEGTSLILARLSRLDPDELAGLLEDAWRGVATPRMRREYAHMLAPDGPD